MNKLYLFHLLFLFTIFKGFGLKSAEPDCEVKHYITHCNIQDEKLYRNDTIVIQINNRSGEKYCDIEIPFSQLNPVSHLSAWIEDNSGNIIRQLKKQDYIDVNEIADYSLYEDYFVRKFTLKHNVYPYRICYTYHRVLKSFMSIADWYPVINTEIPTHHAKLVFDCPENYKINVFENNISSPELLKTPSGVLRMWETSYDGSVKSELFCPPVSEFLPSVKIVPVNFNYGVDGSADNWSSFSGWLWRLTMGLGDLPDTEKRNIDALIGQIHDKKEIVRILYNYMQDNTRYINVTLELGGMKPYPASYVANNKYGDCKALTNYMRAMLSYAGIKSYYATVNASVQPRTIIKEFPAQQFNHVVLAVPIDNDTIWLENTNNSNPFGYAGTSVQNRPALMVSADKGRLVRIPALPEKDVRESRRMEFEFTTGDNARADLGFNFKGFNFELYNSLLTQYSRDFQNTFVHEQLPFADFELLDWKIIKQNRDARNITLTASLSVQHVLKSLGEEMYFSFMPAKIPDFAAPKNRKLPVQLPFPIYCTDTIIYHLPLSFDSVALPENTTMNCKYGFYQVNFLLEGRAITIIRDLLIREGYIPLNEYGEFYKFLTAIKTDEKRKIIIHL